MKRIAGALLLTVTLAGCAATPTDTRDDAGWTAAANASPFESASQQCQDRTESTHGAAFDECMAGLGWTHASH